MFPASGAALVIGASGGAGTAIAQTLAREGCALALTFRSNKAKAEALAADIGAMGRKATLHALPRSDDAAFKALIADVMAAHGAIHTLIYAAGPRVELMHLSKVTPAVMARYIADDTMAFYSAVFHALPHLRATKGTIIACHTTALSRYAVADGLSVIPKAGVDALIRGIAKEEGRFGVRANAVALGLIDTGQQHELVKSGAIDDTYMAAAAKNTPLRRIGTAEDVAEAAVFLASSRAGFITGETIRVDGGYHL